MPFLMAFFIKGAFLEPIDEILEKLNDYQRQAVLDESRQAPRSRAVEFTMLEARLRLERFIRARASR